MNLLPQILPRKITDHQNKEIHYLKPDVRLGILFHTLSIFITLSILIYLIYGVIRTSDTKNSSTIATAFMLSSTLVLSLYWPGAIHRAMIAAFSVARMGIKVQRCFQVEDHALPAVSIVLATRNEPSSLVVPLLSELNEIDYPNFEVVVADNSDVIDSEGTTSSDFREIQEFLGKGHSNIRLVRRCLGRGGAMQRELYALGEGSQLLGDISGGKAENLNEAIRTSHERFKWFVILDADSKISTNALKALASIAATRENFGEEIGFIQAVLKAQNEKPTRLSDALTFLENLYYENYFPVKCLSGNVSNWGHNVLIARDAWNETSGIPKELCEDLAWSNILSLRSRRSNYYALIETFEEKPATWNALKIQRGRWAVGTTLLLISQAGELLYSKNLRWYQKLDLLYDMSSYFLASIGCLIPVLFLGTGLLGESRESFLQLLVPIFLIIIFADNLFGPIQAAFGVINKKLISRSKFITQLFTASIFISALPPVMLQAIIGGVVLGSGAFSVTPKGKQRGLSFFQTVKDNIFAWSFGILNCIVGVFALEFSVLVGLLLLLSPISFFLAPFLGRADIDRG